MSEATCEALAWRVDPGFHFVQPGLRPKNEMAGENPGHDARFPDAVRRERSECCTADPGSLWLCVRYDPGSAAHHFVLRCARETSLFNPTARPSRSDGRG